MKFFRKNYLPIAVTIGLFLLIYLVGTIVPESEIRAIIKSSGSWGIVIYVFLIWLTYIIAPLSNAPILFAGFYLYGQIVVVYSAFAVVIASVTNFWISRLWGRKLVGKFVGEENLDKLDKLTGGYGLQALFLSRVFLGQFHDVISYAFGLTKIKFIPYFIVSLIGIIPGTIIWYYLALKFGDPISFTLLNIGIVYVFLMIYLLGKKIKRTVRSG